MKGIDILIAAAILVLSLAFAVEADEAAVTPNLEDVSGPMDATDQPAPGAVPGKATLVLPSGSISTRDPSFKWGTVSGSTWYYLWINGPSGTVFTKWYTATEATYDLGCLINPSPSLTLDPGITYTWWIQTWNDAGYGPWSDPMIFTVTSNAGFTERFEGTTLPPKWIPVAGNWEVADGLLQSCSESTQYDLEWYGRWNSIYYDADFTKFNYGATILRGPTDPGSLETSEFGLLVQGNPYPLTAPIEWNTGYLFSIAYGLGYSVSRLNSDGSKTVLQSWTESPYINKGNNWNKLKIACDGIGNMNFYINNNHVWSGTDIQFVAGKVGLAYYSPTWGSDFKVEAVTLDTYY